MPGSRTKYEKSAEDRRVRANYRERKRVNELNAMFQVLLGMLPPAKFETRLSRVQILREASDYIKRMEDFLENNDEDGPKQFPHLFSSCRNQNQKITYRKSSLNSEHSSASTRSITVYHETHTLVTTNLTVETNRNNAGNFMPSSTNFGHPFYC